MSGPMDPYFDIVNELTAHYGQTASMDVYTQDYEAAAGTLTKRIKKADFRIDAAGARGQLYTQLPGVQYVIVAGSKSLLRVGDVLVPNPDDDQTPRLTIVQNIGTSDTVGIRTNKIGSLINTTRINSPSYANVHFSWVATAGYDSPIIAEFEGSKQLETNRAVVFAREELKHGMRLIYDDARYLILAMSGDGNHRLLQLQRDGL